MANEMFLIILLAFVSASHFDDLALIDGFKWDKVVFRTRKDCSLDEAPEVSTATTELV